MLIAEIGNNHCGDFDLAQRMIKTAIESGADLVKMQLFNSETINGSMPKQFYKYCQFNESEYLDLMEYTFELGSELFFSVFCTGYENITNRMAYKKLSVGHTKTLDDIKPWDKENYIISIHHSTERFPMMFKAQMLYANDYSIEHDENLHKIRTFNEFCRKPVGLSDHTIGPETCFVAIEEFGVKTIEKHFCLKHQKNNIYYDGQLFRDSVHSSTPSEFEQIAKRMKK